MTPARYPSKFDPAYETAGSSIVEADVDHVGPLSFLHVRTGGSEMFAADVSPARSREKHS